MITLYWKYIKYDIDSWTWNNAEYSIESPLQRHHAESDDKDSNMIFRFVEKAIASLKRILDDRLCKDVSETDNTLPKVDPSWKFDLAEGGYDTDYSVLTNLMHAFVVKTALAEWCATYFPSHVAELKEASANLAMDISNAAFKKKMPLKQMREIHQDKDDVIIIPQ